MTLVLIGLGCLPSTLKAHNDLASAGDFTVYIDEDGSRSIDDIRELELRGEFQTLKDFGRRGLGFTKSTVWMKVSPRSLTPNTEVFILSPRPDFTTMDIFLFNDQGKLIANQEAGTHAKGRAIQRRLPTGRIVLPEPGAYHAYVKIRSPLQLSLSLYLLSHEETHRVITSDTNFYFAYYGTVIALILYNFFLFLVLRSYNYFFYIAFGLSMALNAYVQGGFLEYGPVTFPFLNQIEDAVRILFLPSISSLLFTYSFLQLKTLSPRLGKVLIGVVVVACLCQITLWFFPDAFCKKFASAFDLIAVIFVFVSGTLAIRAGDRAASIFLLAWGILALSVGVWSLGNIGLIEKTFYVAFCPLVGNMIEMILMSLALAVKIRKIEARTLIAEMEAKEKENLQHLLRMISHDISNPLSIIKSAAYISRRSEADARPQMPRVEKAAQSIEGIIQQVRKYDAVRSGKISLTLSPCSLRKALDDIPFYFSERAERKEITLTCETLDEDIWVFADEIALTHEVLNNLVSNAIKFTRLGGRVKVSAGALGDQAWIRVEDNGIGIPKSLLPQLFHASRPTTRQGTSDESGSGFGMPLVKTFVEKFGGDISIMSRDIEEKDENGQDPRDHGTIITVRLKRSPQALKS
ncbi:MAG: sensor histidine kinase [Bdellovibrionota bacterium]